MDKSASARGLQRGRETGSGRQRGHGAGLLLAAGRRCSFRTGRWRLRTSAGDGTPDIAEGVLKLNSAVIAVLLKRQPGDGFVTAGVSSATLTWPIGPVSIASAFWNQSRAAQHRPPEDLPTTLGGIRVRAGIRRARAGSGDLYVSPAQINYVMTSPDTFASIGIERVGSAYVEKGIGVSDRTAGAWEFIRSARISRRRAR